MTLLSLKRSVGTLFSGLVISFSGLAISDTALAAECPEYLDQTFTQLRSEDTINLCEAYAGQPMLIVNTASYCGFTSQFEQLEAVYQRYKDQGLVVVGFPSNDFRQEDDDEEKTAEICFVNYGVTFTMLEPSSVRGSDANPVFKALGEQSSAPKWNFTKYVLDRNGKVVERFGSRTKPDAESVIEAIESVL